MPESHTDPRRPAMTRSVFVDPHPASGVLEGEDVHPGFGLVTLCRDGVEIMRDASGDKTLPDYEKRVRKHLKPQGPYPVWTLHVDAPFESLVYARTSDGWVLIDRKDGFA